jgi:MFS family permease
MAVKQTFSTLAALYIGKLSDRIGRYPCFLGALAAEVAAVLYLVPWDVGTCHY